MTGFLQGAVLIAFFVAANVVAAGVVLVLGLIFKPPTDTAWPWIFICAAGAIAAYLFLKGAAICASERARLQCRAGRRGG